MHLHHNFMQAVSIVVSFLVIWIPIKIVAANFVGRNTIADTVFGIL